MAEKVERKPFHLVVEEEIKLGTATTAAVGTGSSASRLSFLMAMPELQGSVTREGTR